MFLCTNGERPAADKLEQADKSPDHPKDTISPPLIPDRTADRIYGRFVAFRHIMISHTAGAPVTFGKRNGRCDLIQHKRTNLVTQHFRKKGTVAAAETIAAHMMKMRRTKRRRESEPSRGIVGSERIG